MAIGETIEYRMDIWDTAYTLAPGHRLRLWLSSSDTPTHEPLPVAGRNLIFHDATHPSQLLIGTRDAGAPCGAKPELCPPLPGGPRGEVGAGARARPWSLRVPRGLRHVRATSGGRRLRMRRGRVTVAPGPAVRIRGINRRGRHASRSSGGRSHAPHAGLAGGSGWTRSSGARQRARLRIQVPPLLLARPRRSLTLVGVVVALAAAVALLETDRLQVAGYGTPGSPSARAADRLHDALGYDPEPGVVVLARARERLDAP